MILQKKSKSIGKKNLTGKKIWLVLFICFGFLSFTNFALADSSRRLPTAYHESTYCASGCDYSSLQAWEDATDNDLVTAQMGEVLTVYEGVYNDSVVMSGATTNADYFRVIRAADGQRGTKTSGVRFVTTSTSSYTGITVSETYAGLYDVAVKATSTANNGNVIAILANAQYVKIIGNTVYDTSNTTGASAYAVGIYLTGSTDIYVVNNFITNVTGNSTLYVGGMYFVSPSGSNSTYYAYNNTITYCYFGTVAYTYTGRTNTIHNRNIVTANITSTVFHTRTDSPGTTTYAPVTNATSGVTFDTDGYHLKQGVIGTAVAQGTDLSADAVFPFNDDIDGTTITRAWGIGVDWYAPTQGDNDGPSSRRTPLYYYESTYGDVTRNYTSLATWEADTDVNLTTPTVGFVLTAYDDSAPYNDSVTLDGATSSFSYFRVIRAADGQRGTPTSGVRFEYTSSSSIVGLINSQENYFTALDIAAKGTCTGTNENAYVNTFLAYGATAGQGNYNLFVGCTAYDSTSISSATGLARGFVSYNSLDTKFVNCVATGINCSSTTNSGGFYFGTTDRNMTSYIYNCTSLNNDVAGFLFYRAYSSYSLTVNSKNCIAQDNTSTFVDATIHTATHTQTTNATSGVTFDTDGYHLKQGVIGTAVAQGTDLSADATFPFNDDVDGTTITRAWGIGADWYAPTTASVPAGSSRQLPTYYYESTYGNATRNYTSLATWEADTDINLTTPTVGFVLTAYDDAPYNDSVTLAGATTSSSYFRVIRAADGQRGTPTSGVRFEKLNCTAHTTVISLFESYAQAHDIAAKVTYSSSNLALYGFVGGNGNEIKFIGCTVYDCLGEGTYGAAGFQFGQWASANNTVYAIDCVAINCDGGSNVELNANFVTVAGYAGTNTFYLYNCTSVNSAGKGIYVHTEALGQTNVTYVKNCIVQNNGSNITSGGSGTETINQTTNATSGVTFDTDGYHLASTDTGAIGDGTDLSEDASFAFNDDIDGDTRPIGSAWDIGVDEAIVQHTITYDGNTNTGGTVPTDSSSPYNYNSSVTVLGNTGSLVKSGYTFNNWNTAANGSGTAYIPTDTFSITSDTILYAQWTINSHTLTYTAGANGAIVGTTPQTVAHGSDGTAVTADPDDNYHFVEWSDSSTDNPRTDTNVTGDISVTASFAIDTHTVTFQDYDTTELKVEEVNHGSSATPPADPTRTGYTFTGWDIAYNNVTTDLTVTAEYSINNYTVTFDENGGDTPADPTTKNADYNTTIDVLPTAPTRINYAFSEWNTQADGNGTEFTDATLITANITVYAQWTIDSHTLTYTAGANGSIVGTTPQTVAHGSDGTAVTADPDDNYHFVNWSDASTDNPRTDTNVTGDISVTANFAEDATTYTLTYTAGSNGSITGDSLQTVNSGEDGTEITAVPDLGYHFVDWSDSSTENPRTDANVLSNIDVTANFEADSEESEEINTPSNLRVKTESASKIKLEWTDNSNNEEGFKIEREDENNDFKVIKTNDANDNTYTDDDLDPDTKYNYRVRAYEDSNYSNYSNKDDATTKTIELKISEIKNDCNTLAINFETDEFYENKKLDFKLKAKNGDNIQDYEFKNQKADNKGDVAITLEGLDQNTSYRVKGSFKYENDYSDWTDYKEESTKQCLAVKSPIQSEETAEKEEFFVPQALQPVFSENWNLLSSSPMEEFIALNVPKELVELGNKIPQLGEIFQNLGLTKISNIEEIKNLKIALPEIKNLPDNFIVAKSEEGKLQLETKLEISDEGEVEKRTSVLANQNIRLEIKPKGPASKISGLISFKSRNISQSDKEKFWEILKLNTALAETNEELVLQKFEYGDADGDGIYTAEIKTPDGAGKYEIITLIEYQDENLGTQKTNLIMIIDPEGYVFEKIKGREARIAEAKISLFQLNSETGQFELWKASDFNQENPQKTGMDGRYSFLVPEGRYYLTVESSEHKPYKSEEFSVTEGRGIHLNVEMKSRGSWIKIFDWKTIVIILISILLAYNFYRDKMRNNKKI